MQSKKQLFGYTKVRKYKDGHMEEELCDVILGCITTDVRKDVTEEISKGNFSIIREGKEYDILEVPLYD